MRDSRKKGRGEGNLTIGCPSRRAGRSGTRAFRAKNAPSSCQPTPFTHIITGCLSSLLQVSSLNERQSKKNGRGGGGRKPHDWMSFKKGRTIRGLARSVQRLPSESSPRHRRSLMSHVPRKFLILELKTRCFRHVLFHFGLSFFLSSLFPGCLEIQTGQNLEMDMPPKQSRHIRWLQSSVRQFRPSIG